MTATVDVQALIDGGTHQVCPSCRGVVHNNVLTCRFCRRPLRGPAQPPVKSHVRPGRIGVDRLGGLAGLPGRALWVVAFGLPVTQGSTKALAAGVIAHEKAASLKAWRRHIVSEAQMRCGAGWTAVGGAAKLEAVFTVRRPVSAPARTRTFPVAKPDTDKLLRAVQDALSPRSKSEWRVAVDDALIVDTHAVKTYPAPMHTHPWALPQPGVVLRLRPADDTSEEMPQCSLTDPGSTPATLSCYLSGTREVSGPLPMTTDKD